MNIFGSIFKDNKYVGLTSLGLSSNKQNSIYKNNYSKSLFDVKAECPVASPVYLTDQTLYRLS